MIQGQVLFKCLSCQHINGSKQHHGQQIKTAIVRDRISAFTRIEVGEIVQAKRQVFDHSIRFVI